MASRIGVRKYAPANNSLERTGDAVARAKENGDEASSRAIHRIDPRPLSSQPLGSLYGPEYSFSTPSC